MYSMVLVYLVLALIFGVVGVGVWILRGYGFSEFRRSGRANPPIEAGPGVNRQP